MPLGPLYALDQNVAPDGKRGPENGRAISGAFPLPRPHPRNGRNTPPRTSGEPAWRCSVIDRRISKRLRRLRHSDAILWAKDLELVYPQALSFLTALNELRNEIVHRVENAVIRLETGEPLAGQRLAKWKNCIKATAALLVETEADVTANARDSLWLAAVIALSLLEGGEPLRLIDESGA